MLDSSILITMEEKFLKTKNENTYELIDAGMAIIDAMLDKSRQY